MIKTKTFGDNEMTHKVYPGFEALNKRRVELINKKFSSDDHSTDEARELEMLQSVVEAMVRYAHPIPSIDQLLCSSCRGTGEVIYRHWWGPDETEEFEIPCPTCRPKLVAEMAAPLCTDCKGKGYVDPPKTEKRIACVCAVTKGKSLKEKA